MAEYLGLIILSCVAVGFGVMMVLIASFLGPKNKTPTKQIPFECGAIPVGDVTKTRFNVRFYLVAVLFILFDIEVVFLYPWVSSLVENGWNGFFQMLIFLGIVTVGLIYILREKVLEFND